MKRKLYYIGLVAIIFFGLSIWAWLKVPVSHSEAERRPLATFPNVSAQSVSNGDFMTEFEDYTLDQFPLRDKFRSLKAFVKLHIFKQKDNNDIYLVNGHLSKLEYPMNDNMLQMAGEKFTALYNAYMKGTDVNLFFSVVPDKNYYLAQENGYLSIDYDAFYDKMLEVTPNMEFIDLRDELDIEDYYYTDTHWRQENLLPVANKLISVMNGDYNGLPLTWEYDTVTATEQFNGVYVGQSALDVKPDTLNYLTNDKLEACIVTSYSTGKPKDIPMYSLDKVDGKDSYEMFLNGTEALITIENPNAESNALTNKELVVFRDSFGSSLIPLLVENYKKVTVIDVRYMDSSVIGNYVDFTNQDVLFLYSTLVLNASTALRINVEAMPRLSFSDFDNMEFYFTSGAGAWRTLLTISSDGSFVGDFCDAEMGAGKYYESKFSGKFNKPVKVNDYTYSLKILELNYEKEVGTEEQKEDYLYVYSDAYGISGAEEVLIYLPGAPLKDLPEEYKNWVSYPISEAGENITQLPFYGLYNETKQCGFYSYDIVDNLYNSIESQAYLATYYEGKLSDISLSQDKKNDYYYQIYTTWYAALNMVWNVFEEVLDEIELEGLLEEQRVWISKKETLLKSTSDVAESNRIAAELTKERVYQLLEYLENNYHK